jgi:hypothetical protein
MTDRAAQAIAAMMEATMEGTCGLNIHRSAVLGQASDSDGDGDGEGFLQLRAR